MGTNAKIGDFLDAFLKEGTPLVMFGEVDVTISSLARNKYKEEMWFYTPSSGLP